MTLKSSLCVTLLASLLVMAVSACTTPSISGCDVDRVVSANPNQCCSTQTYGPVTGVSGGCSIDSTYLTGGLPSGSCFPTGTTTSFVTIDSAGNFAICSWTYTVMDIQPPVITCPENIVVPALDRQCGAYVSFTPTASDNCGVSSLVSVPASGFYFPVGVTTVTSTAIDNSGLSTSCSFQVTVQDLGQLCSCGNGVVDNGEQCESGQLGSATCQSLGFPDGGVLDCSSCQYDTSRCAYCGDERVDGTEECDGTNFDSRTCLTEGFTGGQLACSSSCRLIKSGCTSCGDGTIQAPQEQCDGAIPNGVTCQSVLGVYSTGSLTCTSNCLYDTSLCTLPTVTKPTASSVLKQVLGVAVQASGFISDRKVTVTFKDGQSHIKSYTGVALSLPAGSLSATFQVPAPLTPSTSWTVSVKGETSQYTAVSAVFIVQ